MTGFLLSPGITPELADAALAEFVGLLAIAYVLWGGRGVELVVGANALVLGAIKLATDYSDWPDVVVAIGAVVAGAAVLRGAVLERRARRGRRTWEIALGLAGVLLGAYKAARDFYDPFDLLMSATAFAAGLMLLTGRYASDRPPKAVP